MSKRYMVSLEISETKTVEYWAEDDQDAVDQAQKIADSEDHGHARVDWIYELRLIHHGGRG